MKRRHEMPFGAECREDGSVRFRLWAPAAHRVELRLEPSQKDSASGLSKRSTTPLRSALTSLDGGWFEFVTNQARPGDQYLFRIDDGQDVPDPASRFQPRDVYGPSEIIDPAAFDWRDERWRGRPWQEAVIYELHVGAFTAGGTFSAACDRLDYLADLGITALELMPVADFPGKRNWGYDGVFEFAPDSSYGRPEDLKKLVQAAHERRIMVLLDVVYNHFGPEGNYLNSYAPQFFTARHHTPWGNGINFDGTQSRVVRDFFIHNALYWLTEYHFDGLRLDAVHAIADDSKPDILTELAAAVHSSLPDRHVHLVLENERNQASRLRRTPQCLPETYTSQWNDDIHHSLHVLLTGERDGYYEDYAERPLDQLGRCLSQGFAYQGEASVHRNGLRHGESTAGLPPAAFVSFLQNHDQIGNRAFGERITQIADARAVRAAMEILLLAPAPPMLFMGEEFAAESPFFFFCDFEKDLASAVTAGRRNEFARFASFRDPAERERIPDPNASATFESSRLDWSKIGETQSEEWLGFYRRLLRLRREQIVPLLFSACVPVTDYKIEGDGSLVACWKFANNSELSLLANLGAVPLHDVRAPSASILYASEGTGKDELNSGILSPWSVVWSLRI
ncbi:MAG: malto-oligosyltrehalose trehalohydrolase [Terriglobales bacterium]|jgi:malto-oligosyltrehalose trehalohydrolase